MSQAKVNSTHAGKNLVAFYTAARLPYEPDQSPLGREQLLSSFSHTNLVPRMILIMAAWKGRECAGCLEQRQQVLQEILDDLSQRIVSCRFASGRRFSF